jgi:uncharacterized protein YuzE
MPVPLRVTFDRGADAAYIYLTDIRPSSVDRTVMVDGIPEFINLDFDDAGRVLGIEVLGATACLPPELLEQAERIDRS